MVSVGVIGCGYWGPNYVRIFNELKGSKVSYCSDLEEENLSKVKHLYPAIKTTKDYKNVARDGNTDSIVVTTPLNTHYKIAKYCLENGKHVLIEKPFTSSTKEGAELKKIAEKNDLVLMVGHVYEYNPGIRKLKEIMASGKLGSIYYLSAERVGLGPIRKYASALWDLATHDISVALYLLGESPRKISAEGESYIQKGVADLVFLTLKFPKGVLCNIHASWIAPEKIRKINVVGSKGMAVFDDVNKSEMLKIYEREIDVSLLNSTPKYTDHQTIVRVGNVYTPKVDQSEPLKNQCEHFLECITNHQKPLTDARDGMNVVRVLEAAEKSLMERRVR